MELGRSREPELPMEDGQTKYLNWDPGCLSEHYFRVAFVIFIHLEETHKIIKINLAKGLFEKKN